jgi:hypothetical protein
MPHPRKENRAARFTKALAQLEKAVNSLPIEELTFPIEREQGLRRAKAYQTHTRYIRLRESIEDLALCAALAHPEAIRELHYLGRYIQDRLNDINVSSHFGVGQDSEGRTEDDSVERDDLLGQSAVGCSGVNEASDQLCGILEEGDDKLKEQLRKIVEKLPRAHFSFPLESLLERDEPPGEALALVSEICDCLIQERLNAEIVQIFGDLEKPAEFQADLPPGWDTTPRRRGGPTHYVKSVFIALENKRRSFRSEAERAELEAQAPSWPSPHQFIKKIENAWRAHQFQYDSERSQMLVDNLPWPLMRQKAWAERAALLPPLSSHRTVITKWVNAGLFWIIAQHDGLLADVAWIDSIERKIRQKGSLLGGLQRFLTDGFETLAGKDRKSENP